MQKNYRKTLIACYLGFITQAIAANFAPLLFLKFHSDYSIPLGQIALISTVFYFTQLVVDVFCARFVDRIGYRRSVVASEVLSVLGLTGLAFIPDLCGNPLAGILACVILYAIGSGLIEVLVSPIVEACPFDHKEAVMSLLHSFYCWGSVGVILLSSLFFTAFGIGSWRIIACLWALIPLVNVFNFATCPIERLCLLRFLGRHHVARNDQSHITAHSAGRHGAVRYAGDGRRPGRRIRPQPRGLDHPEGGRQSTGRNAGWQRISPDIGHIAISHKKADKTSL